MKFISWNVNGIRSTVKKGFNDIITNLDADIICIQETKAQDDQVSEALADLSGYHIYSNSAEKKGYSGVAIMSKTEPIATTSDIGFDHHDTEGRVIHSEFPSFHLVNVYVPNSGNGLKRLDYRAEWDRDFAKYLNTLQKDKPVIVTGDFNVAHTEIDLARPQSNYDKTAGFTQTEIDGLNHILDLELIDSFRHFYPEKIQYTFWSARFKARERNVGWRLDYFLVDKKLKNKMKEAEILDQITGSDHCPITLKMELEK